MSENILEIYQDNNGPHKIRRIEVYVDMDFLSIDCHRVFPNKEMEYTLGLDKKSALALAKFIMKNSEDLEDCSWDDINEFRKNSD